MVKSKRVQHSSLKRRKGSDHRGIFVVVDGLDGIGKGEIERAIIEYEQKLGRSVFDSVAFSKAHRKGLPELSDFWNPPEIYYNSVVTAEPTYAGIGYNIRHEIIARTGREYSWSSQVEAYSLDRLIQMNRVVIPARENGLRVIQSRCIASTLNYQTVKAIESGVNIDSVRRKILSMEGNKLQLKHSPDLVIIPTIDDVNKVIERINARKETQKDDKSIFDNPEFQGKLKPLYESKYLRNIFESHGSTVAYLDAGISINESRRQAVEIYKQFIETRTIPDKYKFLKGLLKV